ncbi:MAG: hypothetical protein HY817_00540 [Candidatus Abawacabacteria bacterium]|nr:hypothetical protein [Candidatus Abawacabacteria bacterium]
MKQKRIGEIILIENESITVECYMPTAVRIGSLISTESNSHYGIVTSVASVCIEEGKASQAFGDADSNDHSLQQNFPHLENNLRLIAKMYFWEKENAMLQINQGIHEESLSPTIGEDKLYWQTLGKLSQFVIEKHINWLQLQDPLFSVEQFIEKLSKKSRPLAWHLYLQCIEH